MGQFAEATRNASLAAESGAANSTHRGAGTGMVTSMSGSSTAMSTISGESSGSGSSASAAGASTAGSSSAKASGATTGGAPAPTGAIAAGLAGVVGILGLAIAL